MRLGIKVWAVAAFLGLSHSLTDPSVTRVKRECWFS